MPKSAIGTLCGALPLDYAGILARYMYMQIAIWPLTPKSPFGESPVYGEARTGDKYYSGRIPRTSFQYV